MSKTERPDENFEQFKNEYQKIQNVSSVKDVNLYNTIHLSENDHTNILWTILRYEQDGAHPFFFSFLKEVLNSEETLINSFKESIINEKSGTQIKSISCSNGKGKEGNSGFIDLVFDNGTYSIIIENKVCEATDGNLQLERYYYSYVQNDKWDNKENTNYKVFWDNKGIKGYDGKNVYVVYLTKDGSKEPSKDSLCDALKTELGNHYIPLSYADNENTETKSILSWLKEDVLPNVKYNEGGLLIQSIKLYIEYIEHELLGMGKSFDAYKEIFEKIEEKTCYRLARDSSKNVDKDDQGVYNEFQNCALYFAEKKLREKLPEGWNVHCAPTFAHFYKEKWRQNEKRKYTIPSYLLSISNLKAWLESDINIEWQFQIEHIKVENKETAKLTDEQQNIEDEIKRTYSIDACQETNHKKTRVYKIFGKNIFTTDNKNWQEGNESPKIEELL